MENANPPDVRIEDGANIEDMKMSIKTIEGFFHAMNAGTFPLRWYTEAMTGMAFLKAIHDGLIKKLGPDEVAKIKASEEFRAKATPGELAGKGN